MSKQITRDQVRGKLKQHSEQAILALEKPPVSQVISQCYSVPPQTPPPSTMAWSIHLRHKKTQSFNLLISPAGADGCINKEAWSLRDVESLGWWWWWRWGWGIEGDPQGTRAIQTSGNGVESKPVPSKPILYLFFWRIVKFRVACHVQSPLRTLRTHRISHSFCSKKK